jgi:hypothetical protein
MPKKVKLAKTEPDAAVEKIKARLMQLKCAPEQIDLHVARLMTIKTKPKANHYFDIGGGHRNRYVENSTRKLRHKHAG